MVTGHNSHLLEETVVPLDVKTIYNPHYKDKNNMYSFALAKEYFADSWVIDADVVLFENVFKETPKKATELVIVRQNASPEWVVRTDAMGKINKIDVTLEQAPSLLGVSYWPKYEADAITKAISEKSSGAFDCSGGYWCDVSRDLLEQGVIEVYAKLLPNGLADELDNVEDYERVCSKL